ISRHRRATQSGVAQEIQFGPPSAARLGGGNRQSAGLRREGRRGVESVSRSARRCADGESRALERVRESRHVAGPIQGRRHRSSRSNGGQARRLSYFCSFLAVSHSKLSFTSSPVENTPSFVGGAMPKLVIFTEVEPVNFSLSAPTRTMVTGI